MYHEYSITEHAVLWTIRLTVALIIVGLFAGLFYVWPQYRVWQRGLAGEAALRQAEQERQILVEQARAEKDSATLRAEAIAIVGKAAQDYPEYRSQEFIGAFAEALQGGKISQVVYVPTEANIPIMEAGRVVR